MVFVIMGPQGSGKSTQAKLLSQRLGLYLISTGTILRDLYAANTPMGIEAEEYWSEGHLVPNDLMHKILLEQIAEHKNIKGYVLEGFPREEGQYTELEKIFKRPVAAVIDLTVDREVYMQRIESRKVIEKRKDETEEAIERRLNAFEQHTLPLLKKFEKDGIPVVMIDGTQPIDNVHQQIWDHIQSYLSN
ncbi:nucleoside monophosphate kinase [candidate division WWE3 bacterium]|nr:nucleoside monophosphate kinase [candidate division WWE3 bacterium]